MAKKFLTDINIAGGVFDSSGDIGNSGQVLSSTGSGVNWINGTTSASIIYQDGFTGDGSTTAFTLANSIDNENKTQVYIDGVYQHKDTFSLSGTTLTFSTAPPNTTDIEVISFSSVSAADDILYDDDFGSAGLMTTDGSGTYSITTNNSSNWNTAYTHSQAAHAPASAEQNVQSDWTASSGDTFIQNKPTIPSGNQIIDWTADQGSTEIHSGNYINTTYTVGDGGLTQVNFTTADNTKLDGIEASATIDQTDAEIRTAVEAATDSNVFTDADHTKLNAIEASATADQTAAEIRVLVEAATDSNVFTDTDHTKLDAIEASADVTDTTNVTAAGALMDSEVTNLADVKAFDTTDYATAAQGTLADSAQQPPSEGAFANGDKTKLDGIAAGAEVNVQSDWSSASGDDLILNKPSIPSITGLATETYVDTAVSDLVDSSPATLNTLNELAAALGDDPNFATTTATSIGTKLPLAGGTLTGGLTGTTADFSGVVDFQGTAAIEGGTAGSGYGVFNGYSGNHNHFIAVRGILANTSTYSIAGGHQTTFVEHADAANEGWYFKSFTTGTYREIARIDGLNEMYLGGNQVIHTASSSYNNSNWDTAYGWGNHASASYLTSVPNHSAGTITSGTLDNARLSANLSSIASTVDDTGIYFRAVNEKISGEAYALAFYGYNANDGFLFLNRDTNSTARPIFHIGGFNNAATAGDVVLTLSRGDGIKNTSLTNGLSSSSYRTNIVKTTTKTIFTDTQGLHEFNGNATFNTNGNSTITLTSGGTNASQIKAGAGDELYLGGNNTWQMRLSGGNILMDNGGYALSNGSMRAPIFYDSDNTGYYVNPNATSNVNAITWSGGSSANANTAYGWGDHASPSYYSKTKMAANRNIVLGTDLSTDLDNGGAYSSYGAANTSWNAPGDYGGALAWSFTSNIRGQIFYDIRHNTSDYSDFWFRSKNNLGYQPWSKVWHSLSPDIRAPKFYDSNNTGYFLNPSAAGGNSLKTLGDWRQNTDGWSGEVGGKMQYHGSNWYIQATNSFIYRNAGGSNRFTVDNGGIGYIADYLTGAGSLRAPVFYDSNNTAYYADLSYGGANTSVLAAGVIRANYFVGTNYATDGYTVYKGYDNWNHFISVRGHCRPGQSKAQAAILGGHQTSFVEYAESNSSTGWFFIGSGQTNYIEVAKITRAFSSFTASVRAPLFYDVDDTNYYMDPHYGSRLLRLGLNVAPDMATAGDILKIQGGNNGLGCIKAISGTYSYGVRIEGSNLSTQLACYSSSTALTTQINFETTGNSSAGKITTTGNSTAYNTLSDHRVKENVIPISDSISRLNQLKPSRFNFIGEPNKTVDGFIAHEVQDIVPEAIVGEKDEVDDDGNPIYQGIDQAKLVPLLVAAIKELEARVQELENN